jgi:hypothetical protein
MGRSDIEVSVRAVQLNTHAQCFQSFTPDTELLACQGMLYMYTVNCIFSMCMCTCRFVRILLHKYSPGRLTYFMDMVSSSFVACYLYMGLNREALCNGIIQLPTSESAGKICYFKFSSATDMVPLSILRRGRFRKAQLMYLVMLLSSSFLLSFFIYLGFLIQVFSTAF